MERENSPQHVMQLSPVIFGVRPNVFGFGVFFAKDSACFLIVKMMSENHVRISSVSFLVFQSLDYSLATGQQLTA